MNSHFTSELKGRGGYREVMAAEGGASLFVVNDEMRSELLAYEPLEDSHAAQHEVGETLLTPPTPNLPPLSSICLCSAPSSPSLLPNLLSLPFLLFVPPCLSLTPSHPPTPHAPARPFERL